MTQKRRGRLPRSLTVFPQQPPTWARSHLCNTWALHPFHSPTFLTFLTFFRFLCLYSVVARDLLRAAVSSSLRKTVGALPALPPAQHTSSAIFRHLLSRLSDSFFAHHLLPSQQHALSLSCLTCCCCGYILGTTLSIWLAPFAQCHLVVNTAWPRTAIVLLRRDLRGYSLSLRFFVILNDQTDPRRQRFTMSPCNADRVCLKCHFPMKAKVLMPKVASCTLTWC